MCPFNLSVLRIFLKLFYFLSSFFFFLFCISGIPVIRPWAFSIDALIFFFTTIFHFSVDSGMFSLIYFPILLLFKKYFIFSCHVFKLQEFVFGFGIFFFFSNILRYADDTTLMAESEEELKSLLMKVKEKSENVGLKLYIQKTKIMASSPITSWEINGETVETVSNFILGGSKITADGDCSH